MLRLVLLGLLTCVAPSVACAQASPQRVVLVDADAELLRAVRSSLAPWGVDIVSVDGDVPPGSMPLAAESGRAIALERHADAVVWISDGSSGAALWVYDARAERSLARELTAAPPFDPPTAAAVALTLKTLLLHSTVAPVRERAAPPAPPPARIVHVELGGGLVAFATSPADAEPRVSLAASVWPTELSGILGFSLGARTGPGVAFQTADASGRWTSTLVTVGVRARLVLGMFDIGAGIEAGLAITTLEAELAASRQAHVLRAAFGGAGWGELGVRPDPALRLVLRVGATFLAPIERYVERGALVLDVSPAAMLAELLISLAFS